MVLLLASSLQYSVSQRELSEWALFDTNQNGGEEEGTGQKNDGENKNEKKKQEDG